MLIAMGSLLAVLLVASAGAYAWRASSSAPKHGADTAPPRKDASTATSATVAETETPESAVPTMPVEPARVATISVTAVGDMIFDRKVKALVQSAGGLAPLRHVASILDGADITVGNLESPLSSGGTKNAAKDVTFRGDPRGIESLKAAGFDFLSLGNNHVLDYGPEALADTASALDTAGIGHAGAGADRTQAWLPAVREVNGASVAFLSFSHILPPGFTATDSRAGLAAGRNNMDAVTRAIAAAKADNDYVIVSYHWGVEYKDNANAEQVRDARASIDAGADMVLSHHPHVIQGIEFYEGGLIAYSTGDFLFDHYSRKTGEAFILQANLGPDGVTDVAATPVYLDSSGAPAVVTGNEATVILDRLKTISTPHGTSVTIASDIARLMP
ncbi:MAG: CapA family protein [Actinomycetota bacterium]|nr:CapA family protein [Actinomycetota bacterium]